MCAQQPVGSFQSSTGGGRDFFSRGPGGEGRAGVAPWGPWVLLGYREAGWIGEGLLAKPVYLQSLSPDPLPASAGFAETGRGGTCYHGCGSKTSRWSPCPPGTVSPACSPALGRPSNGGGGAGNEHLCLVGRKALQEEGHGSSCPISPSLHGVQ